MAQLAEAGCNLIALGEMGIGNTASSAPYSPGVNRHCAGGFSRPRHRFDAQGVANKTALLRAALEHHALSAPSGETALRGFGGFEIAMLAGARFRRGQPGNVGISRWIYRHGGRLGGGENQ